MREGFSRGILTHPLHAGADDATSLPGGHSSAAALRAGEQRAASGVRRRRTNMDTHAPGGALPSSAVDADSAQPVHGEAEGPHPSWDEPETTLELARLARPQRTYGAVSATDSLA